MRAAQPRPAADIRNPEEDELAGVAVDQAAKSADALFRRVRGALDDPGGTGLVNLTVRFHLQGDRTLAQAEIEAFRSGAVEAL